MPNNTTSPEDRERLISAAERDEDFIMLAHQLGIKNRTAYDIVSKFMRTGRRENLPRGGAHNIKIDDEMRDVVQQIIEENPLLTLDDINNALRQRLPNKPHIKRSALGNTIDGMFYSVKKIVDMPEGNLIQFFTYTYYALTLKL